jgi:hypothetical protein
MGRDPIVIDRLLVSVTGGFQPDKLARAFDGDNDGMYARMCFAWPSEAGYRPLSNEVAEVEPEIVNAMSKLLRLSEADQDGVFASRCILLSLEASKAFERFRQFLHAGKSSLDDREAEWWSKGSAQVLRIAGTLAILEWAWVGEEEPTEITAEHITNAIELWREYFWPHSRSALRQIGTTRKRSTERRVLLWLQKHRKDQISIKDVRREALAHGLDAAETERVLDSLASSGWLKKTTAKTGGRPAHRWMVCPILFLDAASAQSAERANGSRPDGVSALPALSAMGPDPDGYTFHLDDPEVRQ